MEWYHALILGIVEGITEFLPVSSTGHLIIASALMGLDGENIKDAIDGYMIVIQIFALLAIVGLYLPRCIQMLKGLIGLDDAGRRLLLNLIIAFIPMGILGPLLYSTIMEHLFSPVPVLAALALGGVWMIWLDYRRRKLGDDAPALNIEDMTWKHALGIGLFQCAAMWPGTSRAMMTIAGGIMLGLRPAKSAEFSFLLGLPTIGGATVYQLYKDYTRSGNGGQAVNMLETLGWVPVLVGCVTTVIFAALAVKWLVAFLDSRGLAGFGWYRIALCVVMAGMLWAGFITLQ